MYSRFALKPSYSNRLEPLHRTTSVRGGGAAELFAAINGRHGTTSRPVDSGVHLPDLSTAGAPLAESVLARPVDFPAVFAGSTGYERIAATAETVLDVQKNGSNIGMVTFAAASAMPIFALPSATSFAAGDRLGIVNEDPADATLAGVSLTFAGTRGS